MPEVPKHRIPNARAAAHEWVRKNGGRVFRTAATGSMKPLLDGPAYVVAEAVPFDQVQKGDVLFYNGRIDRTKPDRQVLIHRAVMKDKHGWIMSGDANRYSENWDRVTPETLMGRAVVIFEEEPNTQISHASQPAAKPDGQ